MDPLFNPFSPGAGAPPPELAGRDDLIETVRIAVQRVRHVRPTKSIPVVGLRGVGKTVLLDRMRDGAEPVGIHTLRIEAPANRSLPAILAPQLRMALLRLSHVDKAKQLATSAHPVGDGGLSVLPAGMGRAAPIRRHRTCHARVARPAASE